MANKWCFIFSISLLTVLSSCEPAPCKDETCGVEEVSNLQLVNKKVGQASLVVENQSTQKVVAVAAAVGTRLLALAYGTLVGFQATQEPNPKWITPDDKETFELDKSAFPSDLPQAVPTEGQLSDRWAGYGLRYDGKPFLTYDRTVWVDFLDMSALIRGVTECQEEALIDGASEAESVVIQVGFRSDIELLSGVSGEQLLQSYAAHLPYSALQDIFSLSVKLTFGKLPQKTLAEEILRTLERLVVQTDDNGWPHFQEDALGLRDPPGICKSIFGFKPGGSSAAGIDQFSSGGHYENLLKEYPWCCAVLRLEMEPKRWPYCAYPKYHFPDRPNLLQSSSNSTRLMPGKKDFFRKMFKKAGEKTLPPWDDRDQGEGVDPRERCENVEFGWRLGVARGEIEKDTLKDMFDEVREKEGIDCCEALDYVNRGTPMPVFTQADMGEETGSHFLNPKYIVANYMKKLKKGEIPDNPTVLEYADRTTWPCGWDDLTFNALEEVRKANLFSQCRY